MFFLFCFPFRILLEKVFVPILSQFLYVVYVVNYFILRLENGDYYLILASTLVWQERAGVRSKSIYGKLQLVETREPAPPMLTSIEYVQKKSMCFANITKAQ